MRLKVTDRDGRAHAVETPASGSLMEVLRALECGVAAVCGGMCSCATCHVYVAPEWMERIPRPQSDERELIEGLQHRQRTSRLSCQIKLAEVPDGLHVMLAPEE